MSRHRNIIISCVLLLMNIAAQAQLPDSVYCYLTKNIKTVKKKSYSTTELLIYNSSKDTVVIEGFSELIPHVSSNDERKAFYWDYVTISNEEPTHDNVIATLDLQLSGIIINGKRVSVSELEKKKTIVVPPNSLFVPYIHMLPHGGFNYLKGYYKLRLHYYENIVAEMIIEYSSKY